MKEKVVLAYSGGLDTTALIPWLKETFDYDVVCCCVNCGQGNELDGLDERAKLSDFPDDLTGYDLIIQCGACMFNRKYVMYRIDRAKKQQVPVTNYGITIAHLTGILDHVALPE